MNLEQRVRDELHRVAPDRVPSGPALDELQTTVESRRRRNRLVTGAAAAVVVLAGLGAVLLNLQESTTDVVATSSAETPTAEATLEEPSPSQADADGNVAAEDEAVASAAPDTEDDAVRDAAVASGPATRLEAATTPVSVETRASAVDFGGGSGVFVVATGDGYAGLAARFGGAEGVTTIGLRSDNGLDWAEVEVSGVPAGATPTRLREYDGVYVAMFSRFDAAAQRNVMTVSSSADLVNWTAGESLPDAEDVAVDLAVGGAGVVVVGMAPTPLVWTGPVTGPFQLVGSIDGATTLAGVVAVDDGFVAAGTADGTAALFTSADGSEWSSTPLSGSSDDDSPIEVSVEAGVITIAGNGGGSVWAAASADGGQTWQRRELDSGAVETLAVRGASMSLLGTSTLGTPTLTLADDSSWSSVDLDLGDGDRVELLVAGPETVLLAANEDGLTWVVASR